MTNPDFSWDSATWFLRRIEYMLAMYMYAQGKNKGQKPKISDTPAESQNVLDSINKTDFDYIAEKLGVRDG